MRSKIRKSRKRSEQQWSFQYSQMHTEAKHLIDVLYSYPYTLKIYLHNVIFCKKIIRDKQRKLLKYYQNILEMLEHAWICETFIQLTKIHHFYWKQPVTHCMYICFYSNVFHLYFSWNLNKNLPACVSFKSLVPKLQPMFHEKITELCLFMIITQISQENYSLVGIKN